MCKKNKLEAFTNGVNRTSGTYVQKGVIEVAERIVNVGDPTVCGEPPKPSCAYNIYYPDNTTIRGNTVIQHVQKGIGIRLSNADMSTVVDNRIDFSNDIVPKGSLNGNMRSIGIEMPYGVPTLPRAQNQGHYLNERLRFASATISGNTMGEFDDGIHLWLSKAGLSIATVVTEKNALSSRSLRQVRGIYLQGAPEAPQSPVTPSLLVTDNRFGCGFPMAPLGNAFVRPGGQTVAGNIGVPIACR